MITLVVVANLVFLGVLIWKAVWLMRKVRGYPSAGSDRPSAGQDSADHGLRRETNAHEQTDKKQ